LDDDNSGDFDVLERREIHRWFYLLVVRKPELLSHPFPRTFSYLEYFLVL